MRRTLAALGLRHHQQTVRVPNTASIRGMTTSSTSFAAGGLVEELHPGTLVPAALAFGWHRGPVAIEVF